MVLGLTLSSSTYGCQRSWKTEQLGRKGKRLSPMHAMYWQWSFSRDADQLKWNSSHKLLFMLLQVYMLTWIKVKRGWAVPTLKTSCTNLWILSARPWWSELWATEGVPAAANNRLNTQEGSEMMMGRMCAVCWSKHHIPGGVWSLTTGEGTVRSQ